MQAVAGLLLALCATLAVAHAAEARSMLFHERFEDQVSMQSNGAAPCGNGWPAFSEGLAGRSADFAGSRCVCYAIPGRLDVNAGTVQFWVKTPSANGLGFFDVGSLGVPNSSGIFRNADHFIMEVKNQSNSFDQAWSVGPVPMDGGWHHVSGVWQRDGKTTFFKVCADGACKNAFDGVTTDSYPNPNGRFCIGWTGWYGFSQSRFDELKVFDYAKSDKEIECDFSPAKCDAPAIALKGARSVVVPSGSTYTDAGATTVDPTDGDVSGRIVVAGKVDTAVAGTYRLSYNVTDSAGIPAREEVRLVHVVDLAVDPVRRAYDYLKDAMDRCHRTFDVYTDFASGCNHATPSGWMAAGTEQLNLLEIDPNHRSNCHAGFTCFRATVRERSPQPWVGVRWLQPDRNFSANVRGAGFNLTGATRVSFYARGEMGGERVEFIAGGTTGTYPDSLQPARSSVVTLTKEWHRYTIDLRGANLTHVISPFGWVATTGATFYLDDISIDLPRPDALRFLQSYEVVDPDQEKSLTNTAFVYDSALALLAFVARGEQDDMRRAGILADTFLAALRKDRSFTDSRLRNAYMSGDLTLPSPDTARLPGWWDMARQRWLENAFDAGTHTGNMAWPMLALLAYHEKTGNSRYLDAAKQMAEWVEANTRDSRGGYTGGYEGWEATVEQPQGQTKLTYKSVEHSIDLHPFFRRLFALTGESRWRDRAQHAKALIDAMWNEAGGHMWVGTTEDGATINTANVALDTQAWAVLALPDELRYRRSLAWAERSCRVDADGFSGFDFNHLDRDGVWFEGTAQMALAFKVSGEFDKAAMYLSELRKAQTAATNADGRGIVAASRDHLTTGFNWEYFSRLHVGATAWFLLAEMGYNPYSNSFSSAPRAEQTADSGGGGGAGSFGSLVALVLIALALGAIGRFERQRATEK